MSILRSMAALLLVLPTSHVAAADKPAGQPADMPATIEYVVRIVHLESDKPIVPDITEATGAEIAAALDGWRKSRIVSRVTTFHVSGREGEETIAEAVSERQVAAGQERFGGRLPYPNGTVPATEQREVKLSVCGRAKGDLIVVEHRLLDTVVWEPLVEAPLDAEKRPKYWKLPRDEVREAELGFRDGQTILVGAHSGGGTHGPYHAGIEIMTVRIVPAKK